MNPLPNPTAASALKSGQSTESAVDAIRVAITRLLAGNHAQRCEAAQLGQLLCAHRRGRVGDMLIVWAAARLNREGK